MKTARLTAELRMLPVFACVDCDEEAVGTTMTLSVDTHGLDGLVAELSRLESTPLSMPVGWASYGRYMYRCPRCKS